MYVVLFRLSYTCISDTNELEAMLSVVTEGNDYAPFKSKIHALAYMLVHSPRPMVTEVHA